MLGDHLRITNTGPSTSNNNNRNEDDESDDHSSQQDEQQFRDIHALTPTPPPPTRPRRTITDGWETSSHRSSTLSVASDATAYTSSENFSTMSREFNALVLAGSGLPHTPNSTPNQHQQGDSGSNSSNMTNPTGNNSDYSNPARNYTNPVQNYSSNHAHNNHPPPHHHHNYNHNLGMIGEEGEDLLQGSRRRGIEMEESNPLAIVPDNSPVLAAPPPVAHRGAGVGGTNQQYGDGYCGGSGEGGDSGLVVGSVQRVKKDEVEAKIAAWQNAEVAKVNNRYKREDAVINGWENEQVQKASSWMKKIERKLEEKRVKAMEKMQNDIAKAHRKAEERRASAESKRGTKVAKILQVANLMRAVGRPPSKRSFFK